MAAELKHAVVEGVPYDFTGTPSPSSITEEMLSDELSKKLKLDAHPVGSVYISYEPTSPAELFGGTWLEMTGVFPYFNNGTETGGSNTHTLTVDELASHSHKFLANDTLGKATAVPQVNDSSGKYYTEYVDYSGGDQPHNNMPSYQSFYAWRRTE